MAHGGTLYADPFDWLTGPLADDYPVCELWEKWLIPDLEDACCETVISDVSNSDFKIFLSNIRIHSIWSRLLMTALRFEDKSKIRIILKLWPWETLNFAPCRMWYYMLMYFNKRAAPLHNFLSIFVHFICKNPLNHLRVVDLSAFIMGEVAVSRVKKVIRQRRGILVPINDTNSDITDPRKSSAGEKIDNTIVDIKQPVGMKEMRNENQEISTDVDSPEDRKPPESCGNRNSEPSLQNAGSMACCETVNALLQEAGVSRDTETVVNRKYVVKITDIGESESKDANKLCQRVLSTIRNYSFWINDTDTLEIQTSGFMLTARSTALLDAAELSQVNIAALKQLNDLGLRINVPNKSKTKLADLARLLTHFSNISSLSVPSCEMKGKLCDIINVLPRNLQCLKLKWCQLNNADLRYLSNSIHTESLRQLHLNYNGLNKHIEELAELITSIQGNIVLLSLEGCWLTRDTFQQLIEPLLGCQELTCLDVSNNSFKLSELCDDLPVLGKIPKLILLRVAFVDQNERHMFKRGDEIDDLEERLNEHRMQGGPSKSLRKIHVQCVSNNMVCTPWEIDLLLND